MFLFFYGYLYANSLRIVAFDFENFFIKTPDKSFQISTHDLSFSDEFHRKYRNLGYKDILYDRIVIICPTIEMAEHWLPFFISSVIGTLSTNPKWILEFKIKDITEELKTKILFNATVLNFTTMIINKETIEIDLIKTYRNICYSGVYYWIYIESMGLGHEKEYSVLKEFIDRFIYSQIQGLILSFIKDSNIKDSHLPQLHWKQYLEEIILQNFINNLSEKKYTLLKKEELRKEMLVIFLSFYSQINKSLIFHYCWN